MCQTDFKAGDIVKLKSGGPDMTIEQYPFKTTDRKEHFDRAECIWFEGVKKHHDTFYITTLEKVQ